MLSLSVYMEQYGEEHEIGRIIGNGLADASFAYKEEWIEYPQAAAISVSLPLQSEPYSAEKTRNFFEGLLPEGFTRTSVAGWLHADRGDYLAILEGLGRECLGAVRICPTGQLKPSASYQLLSAGDIQELAAEGAVRSAELITKSHLSLTGASGKAGLYYDRSYNRWYLPLGCAPSTHIVKQSHVRLKEIVANEQMTMRAAANLGLDVPSSFVVDTGKMRNEEVLFATERYDRIISDRSPVIDNLKVPYRLHQEDFAQALGIAAEQKYERAGTTFLKDIFNLLRKYSARPMEDMLKLWDILVFNWLTGNTDGHIKNMSLLRGQNLRTMRLAPAYDLVSTAIYEQSTREMAIRIGGETSMDKIDRGAFERAAAEAGISRKVAMAHFDDLASAFKPALDKAADEICRQGVGAADELRDKILQSGGIAKL